MRIGLRNATIITSRNPCRVCGTFERYLSHHCVVCRKTNSREAAKRERDYNTASRDAAWQALDAKLGAAGRCACGLMNPCGHCLREAASELLNGSRGAGYTYPEGMEAA